MPLICALACKVLFYKLGTLAGLGGSQGFANKLSSHMQVRQGVRMDWTAGMNTHERNHFKLENSRLKISTLL